MDRARFEGEIGNKFLKMATSKQGLKVTRGDCEIETTHFIRPRITPHSQIAD